MKKQIGKYAVSAAVGLAMLALFGGVLWPAVQDYLRHQAIKEMDWYRDAKALWTHEQGQDLCNFAYNRTTAQVITGLGLSTITVSWQDSQGNTGTFDADPTTTALDGQYCVATNSTDTALAQPGELFVHWDWGDSNAFDPQQIYSVMPHEGLHAPVISDVTNQTTLALENATAPTQDDLINNEWIAIIRDATNPTLDQCVAVIEDFTASGNVLDIDAACGFTVVAGDLITLRPIGVGEEVKTSTEAADDILARDCSTASTTNDTLGAICSDWEDGGRLDTNLDDVETDTADMQPKLGTPAGADISADIATVDANVDSILSDTGTDGVVIANDGITAAKIAADAIGASEIATDAVGSAEIAADAIGASELAANSITSSEVADGAIDSGAFAAGAITSTTIASAALDADAIAADAIGASEIAADALTSSEIATSGADEVSNTNLEDAGYVICTVETATSATAIGCDLTTALGGSTITAQDDDYIGRTIVIRTSSAVPPAIGEDAIITDSTWDAGNSALDLTLTTKSASARGLSDTPAVGDVLVIQPN